MATKEGLLISFDGLDSSGKATQTKQIIKKLQECDHNVLLLQTPDYDTPSGQELKKRLQNKIGNWQETPWQEKLGYFSNNRAEHKQEVLGALKQGSVVVYDRYIPSSLAFMTIEALEDDSVSREDVHQAVQSEEYDTNGMPKEHISIFLDVPPKVAGALLSKRKVENNDEDEYTDHISVQERLYAEYEVMCAMYPERFLRVKCLKDDALLGIEETTQLIWDGLTQKFPQLTKK